MMADCSEEFNTLVISSALFHGVPLFFMSWNCGCSSGEGDRSQEACHASCVLEVALITKNALPPKRLRSNKDPLPDRFL